jgi:hypothetical protein
VTTYQLPEHISTFDDLLREPFTLTLNGAEVQVSVESVDDFDADTSFLGEFSDSMSGDLSVDRRNGNLLGPVVELKVGQATYDARLGDLGAGDVFTYRNKQYQYAGYTYGGYEDEPYFVDAHPVLAETTATSGYDRNTYRYITGFQMGMGDVKGKTKLADVVQFCKQSAEQLESLNRGDWGFVGIVATVTLDGAEIGSASLWGVGTGDDQYQYEVALENIEEALDEAQKWMDRHAITA